MRIVVLTGAGISAESGVPTFRDAGGLWEGHRVEDVATPEAFARDPLTVQRFYDARRRAAARAEPNAAHLALARLEDALGDDLVIVTQNVDDLHERAGSSHVVHMHGRLASALCDVCGARLPLAPDAELAGGPECPVCGRRALRPDIVWFGELPYELDRIDLALAVCDLFVAIGTSGAVYPAAGFVRTATEFGAATLELNLAVSEVSSMFVEVRTGLASVLVPAWVDEVLSERRRSGTRGVDP
ncbi:NAD-dependent deacylase [Agromyces aerolatus]|uniref:NAD-dependent deacylase n=1 Tax=Agromyces sp. LY-1074 TaxID=3074080 RepID=UPI002857B361|nr:MULTISPECIES: NAD-dependent deacylase [unclassified Agromyces]MDR5699683.1 NAD-dependent deacylase [Agromyces sp. LY-1074]MDR5705979.1 NAD-dependent deacylase [Agromyces sp. LY-1358]